MKVFQLTRISSLAPEICPNVLLTGDVYCTAMAQRNTQSYSGRQHPSGILGVYYRSGV